MLERNFDVNATVPQLVAPVSVTSKWTQIIEAGGVASIDAATITNPATQITAATRVLHRRGGAAGTTIRVRLGYDDALSAITNAIVELWGRTAGQAWQRLRNKAGASSATLTTDTTNDATDGTLKYTDPNQTTHAWDCEGCEEFLVGVTTALAGTGVVTNAVVEAKVV